MSPQTVYTSNECGVNDDLHYSIIQKYMHAYL